MYRAPSMEILRSITMVSMTSIFAAPSALADQTAGYTPPEQPFFRQLKDDFYKQHPNLSKADKLTQTKAEDGSDSPINFARGQKGGMQASANEPTVSEPTPQTQAKDANPDQQNPHPVVQPEFTEYSNPLLNNFGPPTAGVPFRHTVMHNANPQSMPPASYKDTGYMTGAPASDLVSFQNSLISAKRTAERMLDPQLQSAEAGYQGTVQQAADSAKACASASFDATEGSVVTSLINVANEEAASPVSGDPPQKTLSQAIFLVQRLYTAFYQPMALLLLLVGAVATQCMTQIKTFRGEYAPNPFEGFLRAICSLMLIAGIPVMVSWSIDVGNSMTAAVSGAIDASVILSWAHDVTGPSSPQASALSASGSSSSSGGGSNAAATAKQNDNESTAEATMRAGFSTANALVGYGILVLVAYQTILICYLYLLGPVVAAFYAWPDGVNNLFRPVFSSWLKGLTELVLWRFWWCTLILCMITRIQWLKEIGSYDPRSPWEAIVYTAFIVMLAYIPFAAFDFRPGDLVDALLEKSGAKTST